MSEDPYIYEFNSSFYLTGFGMLISCIGLLLNHCIKSRCTDIQTPCISCKRDVIGVDEFSNIENQDIEAHKPS